MGAVRNKLPAEEQITAEQILREAKELQLEDTVKVPKQIITDQEELDDYRLRERKKFEDALRRVGRYQLSIWLQYAAWEEKQKDLRRARNVWERSLVINQQHLPFWLKYAEMEMRNGMVQHARNVWERAVNILPRIDQLWYKYIHMEEMLGEFAKARQVFEKWMRWEPDHHGWMAFIRFELRGNELQRARQIFERYVACLPCVKSWVRYAKFEAENGDRGRSRMVYERAVAELEEDGSEELYIAFAEFEEFCKETERARAIYKHALDHVPRNQAPNLYARFIRFEKQYGGRDTIEDVLSSKQRMQFEERLAKAPTDYDTWFDYIKLEESVGDADAVRSVYDRAIANLPPSNIKLHWCRYIYLWINYALYEELVAEDAARAREVYRACLRVIPHAEFTFAKIWILAAQLEIRQKRLKAARTILGMAIGKAPKPKLFKAYIDLETQLAQIDRVRTLYGKYVEWDSTAVSAWCQWAEVEAMLQEEERARAIFELALSQPALDQPEKLWMRYIDFEIAADERDKARSLYERLLEKTQHVKVWISYAYFEATPSHVLLAENEMEEDEDEATHAERVAALRADVDARVWQAYEAAARAVYQRGYERLRENAPEEKEEAVMLLDEWARFERACAGEDDDVKADHVEAVEKKRPSRVKRKRPRYADDGTQVGLEEYYDYVFPDEDQQAPLAKLLAAAHAWKKQKTGDA